MLFVMHDHQYPNSPVGLSIKEIISRVIWLISSGGSFSYSCIAVAVLSPAVTAVAVLSDD